MKTIRAYLILPVLLVAGLLGLTVALTHKPVEPEPVVILPVPPTNVNIIVTAEVEALRMENAYRIRVTALVPYGLHIYSINQKGGPPATLITLDPQLGLSIVGGWYESPDPQVVAYPEWGGENLEIQTDRVVWTADVMITDWNLAGWPVFTGTVTMQPCTPNMCLTPQTAVFTTEK